MAAAARALAAAASSRADELARVAAEKQAASDDAEAEATTAEAELMGFSTPSRAETRAAKAAKDLEMQQLHVSILKKKMDREGELHGIQSPQKQAAETAYVHAERRTEAFEREADWAAAETAEAEVLADRLRRERAAAAKALRQVAALAREAAEAATAAAAEAAAKAAAAEQAAVAAALQEEEERAINEARAAAEAEARTQERIAALHRAVDEDGIEPGTNGKADPAQEILDLEHTFEQIMRHKAEAEKLKKKKGRAFSFQAKA